MGWVDLIIVSDLNMDSSYDMALFGLDWFGLVWIGLVLLDKALLLWIVRVYAPQIQINTSVPNLRLLLLTQRSLTSTLPNPYPRIGMSNS